MKSKGAHLIEYAVLIIILVLAFFASQKYIYRAISGNFRQMADTFGFGKQYEEGQMMTGTGCVECGGEECCVPYVCTEDGRCVQCNDDSDCPSGQSCVNNSCEEFCLHEGQGMCPQFRCCSDEELQCNTDLRKCYRP